MCMKDSHLRKPSVIQIELWLAVLIHPCISITAGLSHMKVRIQVRNLQYSSAPVSTGNTFQDLPLLLETADNTERYM
jgi:hypothetical protein